MTGADVFAVHTTEHFLHWKRYFDPSFAVWQRAPRQLILGIARGTFNLQPFFLPLCVPSSTASPLPSSPSLQPFADHLTTDNNLVMTSTGYDNDRSGGSSSSSSSIPSSTVASNESLATSSSSSKSFANQYEVTISKQEALEHFKQLMHVEQPLNVTLFEYIFVTSIQQKLILERRFGPATNTTRQIEGWVNSCSVWGKRTAMKSDGKKLEGRWLWVLLDKHLDINVIEDLARYEQHCRHHPMTTIGYARKSKGKERTNTRCKLLSEMVHRLRKKSLCTKVYVSPYCDANQPLESRDSKGNYKHHLELIDDCDGDMTTFMKLLKTKFKPIRLAVIDFAGLSTEPNDIRAFVKKFTQIEEIVIDHGLTFTVLSRHDLLTNQAIINKFDCRTGCVKRSA
ncbi:uncharacterized protein ATC70_007092 [Mucor velutinosus]|uniref:Uncharacterized protein n=1 Tax=Mucor velutinosus TaxID=708070 RepID=A0AAN7D4W9_9FUNG|nr:hypothetical protein ATC70_007092 [Mucor velutinosus]